MVTDLILDFMHDMSGAREQTNASPSYLHCCPRRNATDLKLKHVSKIELTPHPVSWRKKTNPMTF